MKHLRELGIESIRGRLESKRLALPRSCRRMLLLPIMDSGLKACVAKKCSLDAQSSMKKIEVVTFRMYHFLTLSAFDPPFLASCRPALLVWERDFVPDSSDWRGK